MELYIEEGFDSEVIDLDDLHSQARDNEDFFNLIVVQIAKFAIGKNVPFGEVTGASFDDDDGQGLTIASNENDTAWIHEVVKLYDHLMGPSHRAPHGAILAYIDNAGWGQFDFDTHLRLAEDQYSQEFDGDYDEFGREYMSNTDNYIPEDLEYYFDFAGYGESIVDEYSRMSWGYQEYLFSY